MEKTTYCTVEFLNYCAQRLTLECQEETLPKEYSKIVITDYTYGTVVTPEGIDEAGRPYFSEEFYQKRKKSMMKRLATD